ncbi:hypothetical protein LL037_21275 [Clostridium estertheticum]|uniref:hypothetical protein n=1 Tax=Clostridium estertheticum TaxID=238834 RepID=UPI001C0BBBCF|nr:hypothetical protein [Clostridium estertheticum]MBU3198276.1 hypothetical protein [Clostridium estertheticum]MCB2354414.1 hypothetical protein [Clostridium estertheticum]WAG42470.1 hypothetical protein LL065_07285 [Clostridium estertheticum]WAG64965.1 hypothetical protein LL037_21275 [Clostridium estertheticum]
MNNEHRSINNNSNHIRLLDTLENIVALNVDSQHTSIKLEIINGMTFSLNWSNGNFNYSHQA